MPATLPDFEYDIFISYRQNDNKYDGWVTEFVNNLNKELEATLKDKVSVYFDANPHDGLLETHSVNHSLEAKLKCLIFIPILSKTYCDLKGFAWNHEFLAFIDQAKHDRFGLNIKLASGNVSSRVLPVRIHDLDPEDVKLAESHLGVIRSVDFIYHSPGVNRSLRPWDDDVIKNTNTKQPYYRDQINKVANAIDELLRGIKQAEKNKSGQAVSPVTVEKSKPVKASKASQKSNDQSSLFVPGIIRWAAVVLALVAAGFFGGRWYVNKQNVDRARTELLPAIQKLVDENFGAPSIAFEMANEASQYIPNDSGLIHLFPKVSRKVSFETQPPGADLFWKDYDRPADGWKKIGTTPLQNVRIPFGARFKIEKEGFQPITVTSGRIVVKNTFRLDSISTLPENMVRIPARETPMYIVGLEQHGGKKVGEFLVDRFEVSNKEYKSFVDAGGYKNKAFWNYPIYINGKQVSWDDAMKVFVDKTGKPGPSTWEVGSYPGGKENHPVAGISWYEASAYASFVGKKLPTVFHWSVIAETGRTKNIIPLSNYSGNSTTELGSQEGISSFGIYDLAGNVREWCSNKRGEQGKYYILGGGWNDPAYSFNDAYAAEPIDRSITNGFRCIQELPGDTTLSALSAAVDFAFRDYKVEKPADDKTFGIFLRQFAYDKSPLNAQVQEMADSALWKVEKVTMDAGYGDDKLVVYLFLPKEVKPPFQPIIFFPGSNVIYQDKLTSINAMDFLLKSGRALIYPVFKGTFERRDGLNSDLADESVFYKDHVIMWRKDFGRTIDYLETRPDMMADRVGYFGWSWGGFMGGIIPAVETRIKAIVLHVGGMEMNKALPEVDQLNFLPRVYQPVLMLNGKHDMFFPIETSQKPMFRLLGTPAKDKKFIVYEAGHLVPRTDLIKESLNWFDHYLGPVK